MRIDILTNEASHTVLRPWPHHVSVVLARKAGRARTRKQVRALDRALAKQGLYRPGHAPGAW
jgi:hypothetical protein